MKLRFEVDQADSFRRGIDRPKSIVSIDVNPADLPEDARTLIADHLSGIDVLQFFYHHGEVIKGYPIKEFTHTSREPKRIVATGANIEALIAAVRKNDAFILQIQASFDRPVQFQLIDRPPKDETEFLFLTDQQPERLQAVQEALRQRRRIVFECFLDDIQNRLNQVLHANSYVVHMLPLAGSTAQGRFYCEPIFAANFLGRQVVAHSPIIVLNEKTGRVVETANLFQAIDVYLISGVQPGTLVNDLSILSWEGGRWIIVQPEGLIDLANDRDRTNRADSEAERVSMGAR